MEVYKEKIVSIFSLILVAFALMAMFYLPNQGKQVTKWRAPSAVLVRRF